MSDRELARDLREANRGDVHSFMRFYDATVHDAYRLARCTLNGDQASRAVAKAYLDAWESVDEEIALSPDSTTHTLSARTHLLVLVHLHVKALRRTPTRDDKHASRTPVPRLAQLRVQAARTIDQLAGR